MKTLNTILLALGAMAGTAGLNAQTASVAKIPFDFSVSNVTLPAGTYTFQCAFASCASVKIMNNTTGRRMFVPIHGMYARARGDSGQIIFHRYDDRYYLSSVWTADGLQEGIAPSRLERELLASSGTKHVASVSVEVARAH